MKDGLIKKAIDASVAEKTKELTGELERAVRNIEELLQVLRREMFTQRPWDAAMTLQLLAEETARNAVIAKTHEAQLTALMRMQEAANEEYTGEERA